MSSSNDGRASRNKATVILFQCIVNGRMQIDVANEMGTTRMNVTISLKKSLDQLREMLGYTRETEPRWGGMSRGAAGEHDENIDRVLPLMHSPDEVLGMLGTVMVEPKDAIRLINGLEIEKAVYTVMEEPRYLHSDFYFPVREEYKRLYKVYGRITPDMEIPGRPDGAVWYPERTIGEYSGLRFIGLGLIIEENGHMLPEKIFI